MTNIRTELRSNIEQVNELKERYKKLSMIFQCEEKQRTALWFDIPINTYYKYSCQEWFKASRRMSEFLDQMSQHRAACEKWLGYSVGTIPYKGWKDDFVRFCNATGIETIKPYISDNPRES